MRGQKNLRDNTLILICSDNGHEPGAGRAGILKGCKTTLFEGGIRSSLVVWGPGLVAKEAVGTCNKTSVLAAIDLVPSLLRLPRAEPLADVSYDGEDVLDTILGKSKESRQTPIFFGRPPDRKTFYGFEELPDLAVRHGEWKLLCDYDGGRPHLYDVITDPGESRNLVEAHARTVQELTRKVTAWYRSMPSTK